MKGIMIRAEFSARDLAAWLDEPYSSVYQWMNGTVPHYPTYDKIEERIAVLRFCLKQKAFEDLPGQSRQRTKFLRGIYRRARRDPAFKRDAA